MFQKFKDKLQHQEEDLRNENENIQGVEPDGGKGDASKLHYVENKLSHEDMASQSSVISPCTCKTKGVQTCQFSQLNNKIVYMGKCIGHSTNGSITYLAMDDDGKPVVAKKWSLPPPNDLQTRHTQFTSLKNDFKAMAQLSKSYLAPYAAMELKSESKETGELLMVFRDFIVGVSLKSLQDKCNVFDKFECIRLLRQVGLGLFSALRELHSVGVLHRDVRSENVFLEDNGGVKLVGASLDARLSEMVEGVSYCDKQIKAQDIYAAALVLVSIVSKETGLEIPPDLPGSARDFFSRCLTEDENCQWPADQLVNHGFLTDALTRSPSNKNKEIDESECENIAKEVQRSISTNLNSRLNDFEILDWLGKGAFGDVLKVKNKLDGRFYALKQVKIDPKNEELKKKITAEVELLSRLNHENVVRYYTAWFGESREEIEGASEPEESSDQESSSIMTTDTNSLVDYLVSQVKAHEDSSIYIQFGENSSSHNQFGEHSSSHIQFGEDSNKSQSIPTDDVSGSPRVQLKEVLYIQMEFCEKNTLSEAINNGLHKDTLRAWRLFREILEGLAYIHQKGMIHRDLKPVNIFLDFNDNVKIGDFGLATRVFKRLPVDDDPNGQNEEEMFLTGQVGTALYAAPELLRSRKVKYDQKVDMYSLGIILFEMFHPPFETFMELYTVLISLRNKKIIMPKSFIKPQNSKPRFIIRMLLNHDASRRPTSVDLLSSKHIPRVVPDETLSRLLAHALSRRSSRSYQMLIQGCLGQQVSAAEDFTFTSHLRSEMHHNHLSDSVDVIQDRLIKVFKSHGAKEFSPPLLTPCLKRWEQNSNAVKVMTSSGAVCHLPYDLRLPFARYIAHSGEDMRRYAVGRVYRESKRRVRACHPVEEMQCAFDIITTGDDTLWPDAELLVVASRAAAECSLKVTIQLNHTDLLRSLLLSCGVPLDKHHTIYPVLADFSLGLKTRLQLQTHLETLNVSSENMKFLLRLMKGETTLKKMQDLAVKVPVDLRPSFYEAVKQICDVINYAGEFGCEFLMRIRPSLAYNAAQHSGVFWQLSAARDQRPAKHRSKDLVAAGGRYDALVQELRKVARGKKDSIAESKRSYVGFSILLEQMNTILTSLNVELPRTVTRFESPLVSVSISATVGDAGYSTLATQRARLARELWARGYSCITNWHSAVEVNIILLPGVDHVRVSYLENNTWSQEMIPFEGVLKFMNQKYNPDSVGHAEFGFTIARKRKRRSSWLV